MKSFTDELRCFDEVGQEFLSVAVVDGKPEEIAVLDEIRFGAIGAHVDFVVDVVILYTTEMSCGIKETNPLQLNLTNKSCLL